MTKLDLKKSLKQFFTAKVDKFDKIDLPTFNYLMLDGKGDPATSKEFMTAIESLYPLAYSIKFLSKESGNDYVVPPLEGLWWVDGIETNSDVYSLRDSWNWTLMIMLPEFITNELFRTGVESEVSSI